MHPHAHKLRRTIAAGRAVIGPFLLQMTGAHIVSVLAEAGFDFLTIDCEHGSQNPSEVANLIEAAWGADICIFVRTPHEGRAMITRSLDAGAGGIVVPSITNMAQVNAVVEATKYFPLGRRGAHLFHGHTRHKNVDAARFIAEANRDLFSFIQVETVEAIEIIDEIAATPGVDGLYVGPGDLCMAYGRPGEWDAPFFSDAVRRVVESCEEHGKIAACHANTIEQVATLRDLGVRVIGYSCDSGLLSEAATEVVGQFRELCPPLPVKANQSLPDEVHSNGNYVLPAA